MLDFSCARVYNVYRNRASSHITRGIYAHWHIGSEEGFKGNSRHHHRPPTHPRLLGGQVDTGKEPGFDPDFSRDGACRRNGEDLIIENPDGTFGFLPLLRNRGRTYATVDHREDTTGTAGGKEGSTSFTRARTIGPAPARTHFPDSRKGSSKHRF